MGKDTRRAGTGGIASRMFAKAEPAWCVRGSPWLTRLIAPTADAVPNSVACGLAMRLVRDAMRLVGMRRWLLASR